ncbi:precorrin-2 C(20)-methyltransferase [Candidatus Bathyarchaeota archaeon]|nr:precorrin-2 C(20)-methyltransferase [Candidatus Bathyarchaeota archaeon]
MLGKLIGVGVGPGDPGLVTLKAYEAIRTADVICAPKARPEKTSMALEAVKPLLKRMEGFPEVLELVFPMVKDKLMLERAWRKNAETIIAELKKGKTVVFITLGDPMFYSTFIYVYRSIVEAYPELNVEVVPGVTSMTACAAASKMPIAEADDAVAVLPASLDSAKVYEIARHVDTLIFIKGVKNLSVLTETLLKGGFTADSPIVMVKKHGGLAEEIKAGTLKDLRSWRVEDYFSTIIVKKRAKNAE